MNVKAVIGLLAAGAAVLAFLSRGGGRRRRVASRGHLGSTEATHQALWPVEVEIGERSLIQAERSVIAAMGAKKGRQTDEQGRPATLAPQWRTYVVGKECERAAHALVDASLALGQADSDRAGAGISRPPALNSAITHLEDVRKLHHKACHIQQADPGPQPPARSFPGR